MFFESVLVSWKKNKDITNNKVALVQMFGGLFFVKTLLLYGHYVRLVHEWLTVLK